MLDASVSIRRVKNIQNVVFFGTHEMAVPALETLVELGLEPQLVVTRPSAGLAPGALMRPRPEPPHHVKLWAEEKGIPLTESRRATEAALHKRIEKLKPDLLVVADYGRALPGDLLKVAPKGAIEVHPSLLPKLRGEHALREVLTLGQKKTGVTVFKVDEEPWSGPILVEEEIEIEEEETFGELVPRAQEVSKKLLAEALAKIDKTKNPKTRKQNPKAATETPRITTRHQRAPWQLEAKDVYNRWRAYTPPGFFTSIKFQTVEIVRGQAMPWVNAPMGETGTYLGMRSGSIAVLCGRHTAFGIKEVRLERIEETLNASDAAQELGLSVGDQFI